MTCPHGVSSARVAEWDRREEARALKGPRPETSMCGCCSGPFPMTEGEFCKHCRRTQ